MTTLPHDIWRHVSSFLSPLFVRDLLSVNRTFFDIAMDARYRQVIFAYLDDRMVKYLVRLKDPAVARRVRILHVDPSFLPDKGSAHLLFNQGKPECAQTIKHRSIRAILGDIANLRLLLEHRSLAARHPKYRMIQSLKRRDDIVQLLSEVLTGLPNVTDYYVSWSGAPPVTPLPATFLVSPLGQPSLRKLSLNISLENAPMLLAGDIPNPLLEELHLLIHSEHVQDQDEQAHLLRAHLAPFLNRLQPSLRIFVISSWEPTDLSPLFFALGRFSRLDDLSINIPVERCHLGDPSGLHGFLSNHQATLRCLRLRPTQYGGKGLLPDRFSLHEWINLATENVNLTNLQVLEMTSSLFPVETSLMCLQRFNGTLTSLVLTGTYRSYDDVARALALATNRRDGGEGDQSLVSAGVGGFGCELQELRLGAVTLCPELVDLIAEKLPSLKRLELLVRDISPCIADSLPGLHEVTKRTQMEWFFNEMEARSYPAWKLKHLSVFADMPESEDDSTAWLDQLFFDCIPSLKTFT